MLVKKPEHCIEFEANDGCLIKELLHPYKDGVDLPYSLAIARVAAGKDTYRHRLKQAEVYYILSGSGKMHINTEAQEIHAGEAVMIPPGSVQWIENTGAGELRFAAIVSPPWMAENDQAYC
jgi:mannose-6-phosphate isomerase-like protein (cupin superfamily)